MYGDSNLNGFSKKGTAVRANALKNMGMPSVGVRDFDNAFAGIRSPILVDGNTFYALANNGKLKSYQFENISP